MAREGQSVIPIQNRYLFLSCAPCPKICNLCTKANCFANLFQKLRPTSSESVSESFVHYTDYACLTLWKSEKARNASGQDGT
jgi:hypothetical protein